MSKNLLADMKSIQRIIPHRYPFLLIDKAIEIVLKSATELKMSL